MKSHRCLAQDPYTWKSEGFALFASISSCGAVTPCGKLQTSNFKLKHLVSLWELDSVNKPCKTFLRHPPVKRSQTHQSVRQLTQHSEWGQGWTCTFWKFRNYLFETLLSWKIFLGQTRKRQASSRANSPLTLPEQWIYSRNRTNLSSGERRAALPAGLGPAIPHHLSGTENNTSPTRLPDGGGCFSPLPHPRPGGMPPGTTLPGRGGGDAPSVTRGMLPAPRPCSPEGGGGCSTGTALPGDLWLGPRFLLPARLIAAAPPSPTREPAGGRFPRGMGSRSSVGLKEERAAGGPERRRAREVGGRGGEGGRKEQRSGPVPGGGAWGWAVGMVESGRAPSATPSPPSLPTNCRTCVLSAVALTVPCPPLATLTGGSRWPSNACRDRC